MGLPMRIELTRAGLQVYFADHTPPEVPVRVNMVVMAMKWYFTLPTTRDLYLYMVSSIPTKYK